VYRLGEMSERVAFCILQVWATVSRRAIINFCGLRASILWRTLHVPQLSLPR